MNEDSIFIVNAEKTPKHTGNAAVNIENAKKI